MLHFCHYNNLCDWFSICGRVSDVKKITCFTFQLIVGTYFMYVRQLTIVLSSRLPFFLSSSKFT